jgi:hypothetical protein
VYAERGEWDGEGVLIPLDRGSVAFDIVATAFNHLTLSDFDLTRGRDRYSESDRDGGKRRGGQPGTQESSIPSRALGYVRINHIFLVRRVQKRLILHRGLK